MKDDWLETELRRALKPTEATRDLKASLAHIPQSRPRKAADHERLGADPRWLLGLGLAGALGVFALGIWIGGSFDPAETDVLALFTGSDLGYMEVLL
jgi:hypothetical protein